MKNKNQPASPPDKSIDGDYYGGLTKREYAAIMAMQGMLASKVAEGKDYIDLSERAVIIADELFNQLDK